MFVETLLHLEKNVKPSIANNNDNTNDETTETNACLHNSNASFVVLATAVVQIKSSKNKMVKCKALLDSGSQYNLITSSLVTRLGLSKATTKTQLSGINGKAASINNYTVACIKSVYNNFQTNVNCFVIPKITDNMPSETIDKSQIPIPANLKLADPTFHRSSQINLLIDAELFYNLLCVGQIRQGSQISTLQKTHLGWIISGPT